MKKKNQINSNKKPEANMNYKNDALWTRRNNTKVAVVRVTEGSYG